MWSLAWLPAAAFHRAEPPLQLRKELRRGVSRPLHPHPRSAIRLKFSRSCLFEEEAIAICISACFILISTSRAPGNGFRWGKYSLRKRSVRNPLSSSATVHGRLLGQKPESGVHRGCRSDEQRRKTSFRCQSEQRRAARLPQVAHCHRGAF